jgi:hypothetical protein
MSKEKSNISNGPIHKLLLEAGLGALQLHPQSPILFPSLPHPKKKPTTNKQNKQNETEHNKYKLGKQNLNIKHFSYKSSSCPKL